MKQLTNMLSNSISIKKTKRTRRHIVVLHDQSGYGICLKHLKSLGVHPVKKLPAYHAFCCHFNVDSKLENIANHPLVKRVEEDVQVHLTESAESSQSQIPWGIQRIEAPRVWNRTQGKGVKVAVLDTGIQNHPDLRIAGGYNTLSRKRPTDSNGHGTHVAGTIAALRNSFGVVGVAPEVSLYNVKAFNKKGTAYISDIIQGIDWCIRRGMKVINMSFGMDQPNETLHEAIKRAYQRGIVMVVAAGNSGPDNRAIDYPARYNETIAVAASTSDNRIADFSSRGIGVDLAAPGVNILSTSLNRGYRTLSGTSMAAPHVSGAAALLMTVNPRLSPAAVKQRLQAGAVRLPDISPLAQGAGVVNIFRTIVI